MQIEIKETFKSPLFKDLWECRDKDGQMIGCGSTKEIAIYDTKTYNKETKESYGTTHYLLIAELA